jgi:hypothetical protein
MCEGVECLGTEVTWGVAGVDKEYTDSIHGNASRHHGQ